MNKVDAEIERLLSLGYAREDIVVLPDGSLTLIQSNEMESTANVIAQATAPARLERLITRKERYERDFDLATPVPKQMSAEQLQEYLSLLGEIDQTMRMLGQRAER